MFTFYWIVIPIAKKKNSKHWLEYSQNINLNCNHKLNQLLSTIEENELAEHKNWLNAENWKCNFV
jgi:hypothetical protein